MQCNIDAKGKAVRLVLGFGQLGVAVVLSALLLTAVLASPSWWWLVAALAVGGAFCVYEGWNGWCVMRAMGFKTPI